MKKHILSIIFIFALTNIFGQFPESFEGDIFPPDGWITFNNGIGIEQEWESSNNAFLGSQAAFVRYENVDSGLAEDWLVTPQYEPTDEAYILSFYQKQGYANEYYSEYTVRVSTSSQNNPDDFLIVDTQSESDLELVYTLYEIDLSAFIGQPIYIAFVMTNDDGDNWFIDDVSFPGCSAPYNLTVSNNNSSGAELNWEDETSTSWNIEIVETGSQPSGVPTVSDLTSTTYTWTGGEPLSEYDFYVSANCSDNSTSNMAGPFQFQTICSDESCDYQFVFSDTYGDSWNGAYIEIRQGGITVGTITQPENGFGPFYVDFPLCSDVDFELVWHRGGWDQECIFEFYDGYDQLFYSFIAGDYPANNEVFYSSTGDCSEVTCRFPYDLFAFDYTINGATISWVEKDSATVWDLEFVEYGGIPTGEPTITGTIDNPYVWTGGDPGTYYDVYVRAVCSENNESSWTQVPYTFTTLCNSTITDLPYIESFETEFILPSCWISLNKGEGDKQWNTDFDTYSDDPIVYCKHEYKNQDVWLVSPTFDFSDIENSGAAVSFDWKMSYYWMVYPYNKGDLNLKVSIDNGISWSEPIWTEEDNGQFGSFEWQNSSIDISDYTGESNVKFAFQYQANNASTVYLDNFLIDVTVFGATETSNLVSLSSKIYPNPANNKIFIDLDNKTGSDISITLTDIMGNLIYQSTCKTLEGMNKLSIDISNYSNGVYFVGINDGNNNIYKKIVKE